MFKLRWCAATALLLAACSCAVAAPVTIATRSMMSGLNGRHGYNDFAYSSCPDSVCDTSFTSLTKGTRRLNDYVTTAMNWPTEGWRTHRVHWLGEMLGPFVTMDFGSTVYVHTPFVWGDSSPGSGDVSVLYQVSVGRSNFAIPAGSNWSPRAYAFSSVDLITNSVDVQFSQTPANWDLRSEVAVGGSKRSTVPQAATGLLVPGVLIAVGLLGRKPKRTLLAGGLGKGQIPLRCAGHYLIGSRDRTA